MVKLKNILLKETTSSDLLNKLDDLFKNLDWTYEMSDDYRYYIRGRDTWENIKKISIQLIKMNKQNEVKKIFEKYKTNKTANFYKYNFNDILKFAKK